LEKLLERDPLDEEALRRLLPLLDRVGRRAEALRRYAQFEDRLRQELDAAPSEQTVAVAAALRSATAKRVSAASGETSGLEAAQRPSLPVGGYLGALPAGTLVGRANELSAILSELEAVRRGGGRLVMLTGEPGVGKTRLAQEVTRRLVEQSCTIITGRCYEIEQSTPYYPFLEALRTLYAVLPASLRNEVPQRWPQLARLMPDLIPVPMTERAPQDEQPYLHTAVTGLLTAQSQFAPVALMIDDLQWCDSASIRLLLHIFRHTRDSPVFILATCRSSEVHRNRLLEHALLDLTREDLITRVSVQRLDRGETAALVAATLGDAGVSEAILDLVNAPAEGNPFFIKQIVQSLLERGDLFRANGWWERRERSEVWVPDTVRATVGRRLSRLSGTTQEILHQASVLGQSFLFEDVQSLAGMDEQSLDGALEEADSFGLVHSLAADRYEFDHALTRQAVLADISPRRLRRIHLDAAGAIASHAASEHDQKRRAAEVAWHYLQAGAEEQALRWSLRAGDASEAIFAHDEAEGHYRTALTLATDLGDRVAEAAALEKLGETLITMSRQVEALPLEERAVALYQSLGDEPGEGRAATRVAWAHSGLGSFEESLKSLQAAIAKLESHGPSQILAEMYSTYVYQLQATGRFEEALMILDRSESQARQAGYERFLIAGQNARGFILWQMGCVDDGRTLVEDALPRLESTGDLFSLGTSLGWLGGQYQNSGDLKRGREFFERALAVHTRRNDPTAIANALSDLALLELLGGNWDNALAHAEQAVRLVEERIDQPLTAHPMGVLGMLRLRRGDTEDLDQYLERTITIASRMHPAAIIAHIARADLDLQQRRPELARSRIETLLRDTEIGAEATTWALPILIRACLMLGELESADTWLVGAVEKVQRQHNRVVETELLELRGELLMRREHLSDSEADLSRALSRARSIGLPYHEAQILIQYGKLNAAQGKRDEARQALAGALSILEQLGARPDIDTVRDRLSSFARAHG
ncbi:MAG TPA: AAA family ATPase, partial [Chloroflexota bacterium]